MSQLIDDTRGTNSQIEFKTSILKSSLCDYCDAYIFVKRTITIVKRGANQAAIQADERKRDVIL